MSGEKADGYGCVTKGVFLVFLIGWGANLIKDVFAKGIGFWERVSQLGLYLLGLLIFLGVVSFVYFVLIKGIGGFLVRNIGNTPMGTPPSHAQGKVVHLERLAERLDREHRDS